MPRGRRKMPTDPMEQIEIIDQKIANLQESISGLKKQRKEILSKVDEFAKQKVVDAFIASGKTADEFLAQINGTSFDDTHDEKVVNE